METIKIDVLVIGTIRAKEYCSCHETGGMWSLVNVMIGKNEFPSVIKFMDKEFDVSEAVVIRAIDGGYIDIESIVAMKGKRVLCTGTALNRCK